MGVVCRLRNGGTVKSMGDGSGASRLREVGTILGYVVGNDNMCFVGAKFICGMHSSRARIRSPTLSIHNETTDV